MFCGFEKNSSLLLKEEGGSFLIYYAMTALKFSINVKKREKIIRNI